MGCWFVSNGSTSRLQQACRRSIICFGARLRLATPRKPSWWACSFFIAINPRHRIQRQSRSSCLESIVLVAQCGRGDMILISVLETPSSMPKAIIPHARTGDGWPIGASCTTLDPDSAVAQRLTRASLAILQVSAFALCRACTFAWLARSVPHFLLHTMRCQKCVIRF